MAIAGGEEMTGTLYGLGIGPGDPELITLKALRIIEKTPIFLQRGVNFKVKNSKLALFHLE